MKFEEIAPHILSSKNIYEEELGIKTLNVKHLYGGPPFNWALFVASKSDGTETLFYARKGERASEDRWHYFCVSQSEAENGLPKLIEYYATIDRINKGMRTRKTISATTSLNEILR